MLKYNLGYLMESRVGSQTKYQKFLIEYTVKSEEINGYFLSMGGEMIPLVNSCGSEKDGL